jgi:hypothetical protein
MAAPSDTNNQGNQGSLVIPEHAKVTDLIARLDDRLGELRRYL